MSQSKPFTLIRCWWKEIVELSAIHVLEVNVTHTQPTSRYYNWIAMSKKAPAVWCAFAFLLLCTHSEVCLLDLLDATRIILRDDT